MKLTPLYDRIIVRLVDESNRTPGGLYIPEVAQRPEVARGTVLAVGFGRVAFDGRTFPLTVKVDDVVIFNRSSAAVVPYDGHPMGSVVMLDEKFIYAIATELDADQPAADAGAEAVAS